MGNVYRIGFLGNSTAALEANLVGPFREGLRDLGYVDVMIAVGDPVGTGIVPSLSHPGGNITGLTSISTEMDAKRLELLREVVPGVSYIALLWNAGSSLQVLAEKQVRAAAQVLRMRGGEAR